MNKFKTQKRLVSDHKYSRLFSQNLDNAGFAYITRDWETQRSLSAIKIDNFIYAQFACKNQESGRLKTYQIRYDITEPMDFIAFSPFPVKIF